MHSGNLILDKSFLFAANIVGLSRVLQNEREFVLSRQMLRSGTSIGALCREAQHAESKRDFIHKLSIAIKEAYETSYWLELLFQTNFITEAVFSEIHEENVRLLKILTAIIKKAKDNLEKAQ